MRGPGLYCALSAEVGAAAPALRRLTVFADGRERDALFRRLSVRAAIPFPRVGPRSHWFGNSLGPGCHQFPQVSPRISRLEKRGVIFTPGSPVHFSEQGATPTVASLRVSPHRDQLRRVLFEFLGRLLDRLALVSRLDFTKPDGFLGRAVDGPGSGLPRWLRLARYVSLLPAEAWPATGTAPPIRAGAMAQSRLEIFEPISPIK